MYQVIIDSKWCYVKCFMAYEEVIKLRKKLEGLASIKAEPVNLVTADCFMTNWIPGISVGDTDEP